MTRSRNRNSQNNGAGQASRRQMDQLDMQAEENRYETESQASTPQTARQREQVQTADRLKELSRRQQDLNERLREMQTALQAARTEHERDDLQRQIKRLQDEQRQLLSNVDEMRQQLDQSPNAGDQAQTRQQLEQTRSDMERAASGMERQSPSEALAAGARAEERMQNLREGLRQQSSSQFSSQMRDMRNQARQLRQREEDIGRSLESMNKNELKTLDNAAERGELANRMARQKGGLTNLLAAMREVTEQSETMEPLLSKQLYDTLRRADAMRNEELIDQASQLAQFGLLPQAGGVERVLSANIAELAGGVERAADSVLGSEADALRFAGKELDDLMRQLEREMASANSNAASPVSNTENHANGSNASASGPGGEDRELSANPRQARPPGSDGVDNPGEQDNPGAQPRQNGGRQGGGSPNGGGAAEYGPDPVRQWAQQLGAPSQNNGPITGADYADWTERMRDVEQAVDPADLRNQLATARERASALRAAFRQEGRNPETNVVRQQILLPMAQARAWMREELARKEKPDALAPLDRDPPPDNYAELVKEYYEKLGGAP